MLFREPLPKLVAKVSLPFAHQRRIIWVDSVAHNWWLAAELHVVILIDEANGPLAAAWEGVRTLGTLGILLEAKSIGKVSSVGRLIDLLICELNSFVSDEVRLDVLKLASE